jgi:hypothetical protein
LESEKGYRDGTAWACLSVTMHPVGYPRRTETRLLGVVDRPTGRDVKFLSADARDETRFFALRGRYVDTRIELARERSFDLLGPLKNLE